MFSGTFPGMFSGMFSGMLLGMLSGMFSGKFRKDLTIVFSTSWLFDCIIGRHHGVLRQVPCAQLTLDRIFGHDLEVLMQVPCAQLTSDRGHNLEVLGQVLDIVVASRWACPAHAQLRANCQNQICIS